MLQFSLCNRGRVVLGVLDVSKHFFNTLLPRQRLLSLLCRLDTLLSVGVSGLWKNKPLLILEDLCSNRVILLAGLLNHDDLVGVSGSKFAQDLLTETILQAR